jgi:hypothetical protein
MEKSGQRHPYVANRFGGKLHIVIAGEPARHVLGQKIGDILAQLLVYDHGNIHRPLVFHPLLKVA